MKKRFLAILLAACMVVGTLPTAFAESPAEPVAWIEVDGEVTYYNSLTLAIAAVSDGGTITLMADITGTVTVSREIRFRLETGSHSCEIQAGYGFRLTVEGNLYIIAAAPEVPVEDCPRDESCPAAQFTDVNLQLWYHDGIHYAVAHHLMNGTGEHTFSLQMTTTRAMLVTVLFRFEGEQRVGKCPFADVQEGTWYAEAIAWAAANQIVEGYGNGRFGPRDPITREQLATILWRYAAYKGYDVSVRGDLSAFADGDQVSGWARCAMEWAVGMKLIIGKGNDCLDPRGYAVRSEFATVMMRFCEDVAK